MSSSFLPPCHFNIFPFLLFPGDTRCLFILLVQHLDCTLAHCRRRKRKRNIEIASPYPVHPKSQHAPGPQLGKPGRGFVGRKFFSRLHLLPNPPVFCHHFPCPLQAVSWPCPCLDTIPYHTIPYPTNMSLPRHSRAHIFWSPPHFPPRHHHHHHMPNKNYIPCFSFTRCCLCPYVKKHQTHFICHLSFPRLLFQNILV